MLLIRGMMHGTDPHAACRAARRCLWELLTWQLPFNTVNRWGLVNAILTNQRPEIPASAAELPGPDALPCLPRYLALMQACWAADPATRPTFAQIIPHLRCVYAPPAPASWASLLCW